MTPTTTTTTTTTTPFERDILDQPRALRAIASHLDVDALGALRGGSWSRIVLTGMGSSHHAGAPTWQTLTRDGRAVWRVDTGQLLETPELLTPDSLLIVTSQSGASGEVVELLDRLDREGRRPRTVVGVCADPGSPLARRCDVPVLLHSGSEATVSTKSYLNTLVAHAALTTCLLGGDVPAQLAEAERLADVVASLLEGTDATVVAQRALGVGNPRLMTVGKRVDAATAQFAALITKESAKVAVEGFVGGQFRHGPFELAGPGLTLFLYGAHADADEATVRLAKDVQGTGAQVVLVGDLEIEGTTTLHAPAATPLEGLVTGAVVAQFAAVSLARANGVAPGEFAFGSKITTAL